MFKSRPAVIAAALAVTAASVFAFQNCGHFTSYNVPKETSQSSIVTLPTAAGTIVRVGELQMTDIARTAAMNIGGRVTMLQTTDGKTEVYVYASGLTIGMAYPVHVHNLPCNLGGGAHYKVDTSIVAADANNEMWPSMTALASGDGYGHATLSTITRPEAQSIVIHDPVTVANRLACADLAPERKAVIKGGKFVQTAAGLTLGINPIGNGVIVRNANPTGQTIVRFSVKGLSPSTAYGAHVHSLPCSNTDGGPHYKRNLLVTETVPSAANEIWPLFTTDATGSALVQIAVDGHVARADAASIVIHYPIDATKRLTCMDLVEDAGFVTTVAGLAQNSLITGYALMTRKPSGTTEVSASVKGLTPNTAYVAHVHDHPCNISGGGGHYKFDASLTAASATNEIWLSLNSDATGAASATVSANSLVRPEAQSIVIHDPLVPATRLACVDLY